MKSVPVWLYPESSIPSAVNPDCAVVNIEEHTECSCGCAKTADSCNSNQIFEESQCDCLCLDQAAKEACYNRPGWYWNENTCQCMCQPIDKWPQCPTGYQFDPLNTCSCVNFSEYAGAVLIIMVIILVLGTISAVGTLYVCHKQKLGLFKSQRRDTILEKIRKDSKAAQEAKLNEAPLIP